MVGSIESEWTATASSTQGAVARSVMPRRSSTRVQAQRPDPCPVLIRERAEMVGAKEALRHDGAPALAHITAEVAEIEGAGNGR